jgi:hypothetical protein
MRRRPGLEQLHGDSRRDGVNLASGSPPRFASLRKCRRAVAQAKRWLAEIYQILAVTPLPGQSDLDVQPHPWLPNVYTVRFLECQSLTATDLQNS